ncbi:MAG: DNA-3-methyladenine glycosylase [Actinomycetota bacterium]
MAGDAHLAGSGLPPPAPGALHAEAWGPGRDAALEALPALVGDDDDASGFVARDPAVRRPARRLIGVRLGRTGAVVEALLPAILEQKVTGDEARRTWRRLVHRFGEPAPGPAGLRLPPSPAAVAVQPYHALHSIGLERRRAEVLSAVCRRSAWLEESASLSNEIAYARLMSFRGIGAWTAAEVGVCAR